MSNKATLAKMETFINKQDQKMKEKFNFEQLLLIGQDIGEEEEDETDDDAKELHSDEEENVESNETVLMD